MDLSYSISWHPSQVKSSNNSPYQELISIWQQRTLTNLPDYATLLDSNIFQSDLMFYHVFEYYDLTSLPMTPSLPLVLVFHYQPESDELPHLVDQILPEIHQRVTILGLVTLNDSTMGEIPYPSITIPWGVDINSENPVDWTVAKTVQITMYGDGSHFFCHQIATSLSSGLLPKLQTMAQQHTYAHYGPLPIQTTDTYDYHLPAETSWQHQTVRLCQWIRELIGQSRPASKFVYLPLLDTPTHGRQLSPSELSQVGTWCEPSKNSNNQTRYNGYSTKHMLKQYQAWSLVQTYQDPSQGINLLRCDYETWPVHFGERPGYQVFPYLGFKFRSTPSKNKSTLTQAPLTLVTDSTGRSDVGIPPFYQWELTSETATYLKLPTTTHASGFVTYLKDPSELAWVHHHLSKITTPIQIFYRDSIIKPTDGDLITTSNWITWVDLDRHVGLDPDLGYLRDPLYAILLCQIELVCYLEAGLWFQANTTNPSDWFALASSANVTSLPLPPAEQSTPKVKIPGEFGKQPQPSSSYASCFYVRRSPSWYGLLMANYVCQYSVTSETAEFELADLLVATCNSQGRLSVPSEISLGLIGNPTHDLFVGTPLYHSSELTLYLPETWYQQSPPTHWVKNLPGTTCLFEPRLWSYVTPVKACESLPIKLQPEKYTT